MRHLQMADENIKGLKLHVFSMLIPYISEFRRRIATALVFMLLAKLASVSLPFFLKYIVDGLEPDTVNAAWILLPPMTLVIAYGFARFLNVIFNELRDTVFGRVTEHTMRKIGLKTFVHLHSLDLEFHLNRRTGGLSRDIERGISGISFLMRFLIFNILPTLFEVLLVVCLLFYNYEISYALITLFSVAIYVCFSIYATEWRTRYVREENEADSASNTRAIDSLMNYETVKYFTNEAYEAEMYDHELMFWEQARRKNRLTLFALNAGQALIIAITMTSLLALAASEVLEKSMTIGDFVLVNAFMMQLFIPLNFLGFVYREIKSALANIDKMFDLLKVKPSIKDAPSAYELISKNNISVSFKNVAYHYHSDREILHDINFKIQPGQKIAIVGESGAGKSTLVKLLFRFYDVTGGSISIDDQDIRSLSLHSLRKAIGIVPQDTVLFNDTILENVRYGKPEASNEEVLAAMKMAHLDDFIAKLPKGYNTMVGERGLKLSGGEKQRVAIARTLLKNPPLLVFDEATSSLDSQSEQAILEAIREISRGHTSLVIAHRLSTVVDADKIIVLDNGRIVEQGTHQQLLVLGKKYAKLWNIQQSQTDAN